MLVAFPQPVEHAFASAGELGLFVVGQRVGADDRDAPPAVEDRLGGGEVVLGAGAGGGLGELGLELRALLGDSRASAARTAGPERSILVVAVVIGPVSRRPAARERSARRPAVADPWAVDRRLPARSAGEPEPCPG